MKIRTRGTGTSGPARDEDEQPPHLFSTTLADSLTPLLP